MTIYFTEIHLVGGTGHQHIASFKWRNAATGEQGISQTIELVRWLKEPGNFARVKDQMGNDVAVGVVNGSPEYLRSYRDTTWTDNLLALPKF